MVAPPAGGRASEDVRLGSPPDSPRHGGDGQAAATASNLAGSSRALYWELASQEELAGDAAQQETGGQPAGPDEVGAGPGGVGGGPCQVLDAGGDVLVFEDAGRHSLLRRFVAAEQCWRCQPLSVAVHASVLSPVEPWVVCLLHCPSDWNSDHRYEVYAFDTETSEFKELWVSSSKSDHLVDAGIAPKRRHGFSVVPFGRCLYFLCGLQHFPGDTTGSFVYCFSLDDCVWTEVEYTGVFPAPYPESPYAGCRFGQSCAVHDGKAWLFGGCVRGGSGVVPTNGLFTFDLTEHRWEAVALAASEPPPPMAGHTALVCCGRMLVFGGEGASQDVYSYNMEGARWELLPPMMLGPRPADGRIFCCISGNRLVAYQQRREEAPGAAPSRRHELYNLGLSEVLEALEHCGGLGAQLRQSRQELDLLGDEATADMAFMVEGKKVVAHRPVLQRFAPALARAREGASPGRPVPLQDVKCAAFRLMLEHIYSRFAKPLLPADAEVLLEPAQRFELADLALRCQQSIIVDASNVRHFLSLALAIKPPLELLNQKCIEYLISHPEHQSLLKGPRQSHGSGPASPEQPADARRVPEAPTSSAASTLLSSRGSRPGRGAAAAAPELQPRWSQPLAPRPSLQGSTLQASLPLPPPPPAVRVATDAASGGSSGAPSYEPPRRAHGGGGGGPWARPDSGSPPYYHLDSRFHVLAAPQQPKHSLGPSPSAATILILDTVVTGKELLVNSRKQRFIIGLTVICCFLLFRLPALVVAERCGSQTARAFEAGNTEARFHSMNLFLQSIWRMVWTALFCMLIYLEGLLNALLMPPCVVVGPGDDLASTCQAYVVVYSILLTGNLGFLLFSMAAMSLDLRLLGGLARRGPRGLTREHIEKLRMHDFGDPAAPPTGPQCTICLGDFDPGDKVRYLPCGHHYHAQCVDEWLAQKAECPMRCHVDLRLLATGSVIGDLLDLEMQGSDGSGQGPLSRPV